MSIFNVPDLVNIILHKIPKENWGSVLTINSVCYKVVVNAIKGFGRQLNPFQLFKLHIRDDFIKICPKCFKKPGRIHYCTKSTYYKCKWCYQSKGSFNSSGFRVCSCGLCVCESHLRHCITCNKTTCIGCTDKNNHYQICKQCARIGPSCYICGDNNKSNYKFIKKAVSHRPVEHLCLKCHKTVCNSCSGRINKKSRNKICKRCY
jgi:hypothetical protein